MSVTFYVEGWADVRMVDIRTYAKDEYPNLDRSDFVDQHGNCDYGYYLDEKGLPYRIEQLPANDIEWPEVNRNNSNAYGDISQLLSNGLGTGSEEDFVCGELSAEAVNNLPYQCIPHSLSRLIVFARQRGKGIYWG